MATTLVLIDGRFCICCFSYLIPEYVERLFALIIVSVAASSQGGSSPGFTESELSQHTQFSNGQLLRDTAFIVRAPNRILMVKARVWAFHALTDEWVVALIAG